MKQKRKRILLDFERMQSLYTGFYYFNLHFGNALLKLAPEYLEFSFYLIRKQFGMFGKGPGYVSKKSYTRSAGFIRRIIGRKDFDIIHISDQHSSFIPIDTKAKIILTVHDLNYLIESTD